jgi:hypothetical protein
MTAVMRSVAQATGPKVLRVGLVLGGRLVEERLLQKRTSVSVGSTEQAMFIVEAKVPPKFKLFERIGDTYYLNIIDGMSGRLALPTGIADLETLRAQAPGEPTRSIRIGDETRGKVVIGAATFLFQFVTPAPVQPRPRLPLSVKDGVASRIDWMLTAISAFSFLLHFGVVGAMYSDWMDTVVDDDITVGLVHTIEPSLAPVTETRDEAVLPAPAEEQAAAPSPTRLELSPSKTGRSERASPEAALDALLGELNRIDLTVIGSVNGGPSLRAVMASNDNGVPVDLDALGRRRMPVGRTSSGLDLPTGGPLDLRRSDFGLPTHETASAPSGAGRPIRFVFAPEVYDAIPVLSATLPDAEAVIRTQIHPGARRCYEIGLESDPTQSGKLVLMIRVAPSGEVDSASIASNAGLSPAVASCVALVARRAKFGRTGPGGATIVVPFGFLRQGG